MEPNYVWVLNYSYAGAMVIKLTNDDKAECARYDDFENFVREYLSDKYDFRPDDCLWMVAETYEYDRYGF